MDRVVKETRSVCCYCGTGCGVVVRSIGDRIVDVYGDPEHPANRGRLCSKGSTLHLAATRTGRATAPLLRDDRNAAVRPVNWDEALNVAAARFARIVATHGPDAVAFYVSGQLLTEDYYVFNKLARALIGTNNIDSNSRLCMSSAVAAYKATLGADAVPCCYDDIELADLMLIAGSNTAYAHPIVFRRIEAAKEKRPELKIIVIDPRRTDTAAFADLHLAISPGSDTLLYSAMLHVLLWEGRIDEKFIAQHTSGFGELRTQLAELTPGAVAGACGVGADQIVTAARWFGAANAPLSFWCQGLNQSIHGTVNGAALIHLHLATGTIGRPGMGPFSLTGQPNAMGGRETGTMANLLPGHRNLADPGERAELASLWDIAEVPVRPGKTAIDMFRALESGDIKAVWIACTNPAQSLPDLTRVRAALTRAEFVVVQEAWGDTETAAYADLLLPAATWGEKEGTVTNSERRISRVRQAVPPPGAARADWQIVRDFARAYGVHSGDVDKAERLFAFDSPAAVHAEYRKLTAGRDLDIEALSYARLDAEGPTQWPYVANTGTARLYADHRFAFSDSKARFLPIATELTAEVPDARHPFRVLTGRLRDQWHGMSRTGRVPRLYGHEPEPCVRMHPSDIARRNWREGQIVRMKTRRGEIVLPLAASTEVHSGQVFVPMHWGRRSLSHDGINTLTLSEFDPTSKQPELKHAVARIEVVELPWRMVALRSPGAIDDAQESVLAWRERLAPLLADLDYAALTLDGRDRPLVALRVALAVPPPPDFIERIGAVLDMPEASCLAFRDPAKSIVKRARIDQDQLTGILLAGEDAAAPWLRSAIIDGLPVADIRRWIFAPLVAPPVGSVAQRKVVCNCFNVDATAIMREIDAGADLPTLTARLKCGSSCGSCLPEIRRMLADRVAAT